MPLYEYECASCGKVVEAIQKFSDAPLTECPDCGGGLERLLSAPAIQFKGSGWYITDYSRKNGDRDSKKAAGDAKSGDTGESKSVEASESKPAKSDGSSAKAEAK